MTSVTVALRLSTRYPELNHYGHSTLRIGTADAWSSTVAEVEFNRSGDATHIRTITSSSPVPFSLGRLYAAVESGCAVRLEQAKKTVSILEKYAK